MKKAQLFSSEFLLAYFVFLVVLSMVFYLWFNTTREITRAEDFQDMGRVAVKAAEQLVRTKGSPDDWAAGNVTSLGFANDSRVLMPEKILAFLDMMNASKQDDLCSGMSNYDCERHLMGLGKYHFYFQVIDLNDSDVSVNGVELRTGMAPANETQKITIRRTSILNNDMVRVILTVWEE